MDEEKLMYKNAQLGAQKLDAEELEKINRLTIEPLKAEDVFAFKVSMGTNELDDRNNEPFSLKALKDMEKLYIGKPVIKDHKRAADNQIARIYDTKLVLGDTTTEAGEVHGELYAKCYTIAIDANADLIADIKAGIRKEVSTATIPEKFVCSICGKDNMEGYCRHLPGRKYNSKTCYFTIDGVKEAAELSFVTVPAQPNAGVVKAKEALAAEEPEPAADDKEKSQKFRLLADYYDLKFRGGKK